MEIAWLSFISLILVSSTSLAQSDITPIPRDNKVSFDLPEKETVVIAFSQKFQNARTRRERFGYSFSVQGEEVLPWREVPWVEPPGTEWQPFLYISNETIETPYTPYMVDVGIPVNYRTIKGREVTVSSSPGTRWQVISLPLEDRDLNKTTAEQTFYVNLPEKNTIWIAFWNNSSYSKTIEYGNKLMKAYNGWSVISLSMEDDQWKGQRPQVRTDDSIFFQLFSMPLEATATSFPMTPTTSTPIEHQSAISITTKDIVIITLVIGIVIVLVAGGFLYWWFFKKNNQEPSTRSAGLVRHNSYNTQNSLYGVILK